MPQKTLHSLPRTRVKYSNCFAIAASHSLRFCLSQAPLLHWYSYKWKSGHWIFTKLNVALVDKWFKKAGLHTMMNANCRKKDNFQNYSNWFKWIHAPFPPLFLELALILALTCGWWVEDLSLIESACSATWPWHIAPSEILCTGWEGRAEVAKISF